MSARLAFCAAGLLAACATPASAQPLADPAAGQRAWAESCKDFDDWDKAGPPFRIFGNSFYVGTCGISSILIVSPDGHTLIDSGTDKGAEIVLANIRALGFEPTDVKALLMSHEHFDHVGGMARLQAATGATIVATESAAAALRSGLPTGEDPQAHADHPPFPPVTGRIVQLDASIPQLIGDTELNAIPSPGHSPGALSWQWKDCEAPSGVNECRTIVYVDSLSPISSDDYRFADHTEYLGDYRAALSKIASLECDIVLAPHPSAAGIRDRLLGTRPLIDPDGCRDYAASITRRLDARLAEERRD